MGNKADLPKVVDSSEAEALAASYGIQYFSVSAKTGENVNSLFESVAEVCLKRKPCEERPHGEKLAEVAKKAANSKCC